MVRSSSPVSASAPEVMSKDDDHDPKDEHDPCCACGKPVGEYEGSILINVSAPTKGGIFHKECLDPVPDRVCAACGGGILKNDFRLVNYLDENNALQVDVDMLVHKACYASFNHPLAVFFPIYSLF